MKFQRGKVWLSSSQFTGVSFIFTYSGSPSAAKVMFHKIRDEFGAEFEKEKTGPLERKINRALGRVYASKDSKGIDTLIGLSLDGSSPCMVRTHGQKVVEASAELLGVGDSSVLHYLSDLLLASPMNVSRGISLGCYLVSCANRYISGCGGGPDIAVLRSGVIQGGKDKAVAKRRTMFKQFEKQVRSAFFKLSVSQK